MAAGLRKVTEQLHLLEACHCPVVDMSSDKVPVDVIACVIQSGAKRTYVLNLPAISFFGVTSNQKSTFENLVQSTI